MWVEARVLLNTLARTGCPHHKELSGPDVTRDPGKPCSRRSPCSFSTVAFQPPVGPWHVIYLGKSPFLSLLISLSVREGLGLEAPSPHELSLALWLPAPQAVFGDAVLTFSDVPVLTQCGLSEGPRTCPALPSKQEVFSKYKLYAIVSTH